ncbi:hypothetical protein [Agromyces ramosus]|uniref:hypothetical protein n=1 Tax=Agromyces ramosus TaxID=33879 RepID=UPI0027D8044A|nr:hypothetical protein [Agromyces ramosus]
MNADRQPSFEEYCAEHDIQPGEEPAAFAAYLHMLSDGKWDGDAREVSDDFGDGRAGGDDRYPRPSP